MNKSLKLYGPSLLLIALMIGAGLLLAPHLPAQLPIHFDEAMNANSYADKFWALALPPAVSLGLLLLLPFLMRPKFSRETADEDEKNLAQQIFSISFLFFILFVATCLPHFSEIVSQKRLIAAGLGIFLWMMAKDIDKLRQNSLLGIRTPWSMKSKENWERTHVFTKRLLYVVGAICLILALKDRSASYALPLLLKALLFAGAYSAYLHYRDQGKSSRAS